MQAAHDGANAIRLNHVNSVKRVDFINGGSTMVSKEINTTTTKANSIVQTYVKGEVSVSIIGSASAQATIRGGELLITLSAGANGKIGASATLTGGITAGDVGKRTATGSFAKQLPYFTIIEGSLSYDLDEGVLQGMAGGIGAVAEIPIYTGDYLLGYEFIEFRFSLTAPSYPMTAREWEQHLGGKK